MGEDWGALSWDAKGHTGACHAFGLFSATQKKSEFFLLTPLLHFWQRRFRGNVFT